MNELEEMLPEALRSEKVVLGCLIQESARMVEIAGKLNPDDFSLDSHRRIFSHMTAMDEFDFVSLCQSLTDSKELSAIGGIPYVASLTEGMPFHMEIENHVSILRDKAISRRVLAVCEALSGQAYSQDVSGLEIVSSGLRMLSAIAEDGQKTEIFDSVTLGDDSEYRLLDNPTSEAVISTGLRPLDEFTGGGIRLGELWIIGASPSRGKTTLARQIVKDAISRGIPAYAHSGEMTKESWYDVTACLVADVPAWKIREPRLLNLADKERLRQGIRELRRMPFYLSDTGGIQLDKLIWNATREVKTHGIKLVAVDYAQIIVAPGRDDRQRVTAIAQRLRLFAKDMKVAVLLLSQSPRPEGKNLNRRPTMFDLKESGALEEAAHCVVLPYRPVDPETGAFTGADELIIGKQRWGGIGSIPVKLNGEYLRFEER